MRIKLWILLCFDFIIFPGIGLFPVVNDHSNIVANTVRQRELLLAHHNHERRNNKRNEGLFATTGTNIILSRRHLFTNNEVVASHIPPLLSRNNRKRIDPGKEIAVD